MTEMARAQLLEAMAYIAAESGRFGEATVATATAVLQERLAALEEPEAERQSAVTQAGEQRKQATILFASIDGLTRLKSAHSTARLHQIDLLWRQLDETVRYYGGVVDKHMGDVIMGIFGAPVAHENDPERAVRCAMALRDLVAEFLAADQEEARRARDPDDAASPVTPLLRIGINTGQVSLGQVGSDARQTAIGDAVNIASRLKETAAGPGIYISRETYLLVRKLFRVEALGEIAIKGRQTRVAVYRVAGALPRLFFQATEELEGVEVPMIGREAELAALREALERTARDGRGGTITIVGDSGIGKSRLVREFHRQLDAYDINPTVLQARADQRLSGVPYSLLRDLFVRHFAIEEGDNPRVVEDKITARLAAMPARAHKREQLRGLARAFGQLVSLGARHEDISTPHAFTDTLVAYLEDVIHHSPVMLLFLEDIHWADEDSLALLQRLANLAAERPFLMLCLARPAMLDRRPDWPGEKPLGAMSLPLRPLDESQCRELVLNILRRLPQAPPGLTELIVRSAAGNPYYVEELVHVLIEDGVIIPGRPTWSIRPRELTHLRVPATLTGVLQSRLDRLPELERVTLQQAAVVGDEFWDGAVQQMNRAARFPFSEAQVAAALRRLERRDMIARSSSTLFPGNHAYLFRHTILREVAYESVLLRDRPGYHLQVARWLAAQVGDRADDYAAPIALHYELAGRLADAARLYEQAADRAMGQSKLPLAIEYYRKVLDLLGDWPQYRESSLPVLGRLGSALQQRGRLVEALTVHQAKHDYATLDGNLLRQARADIGRAAVYLELADAARAREAAAQAEQAARLTGAEPELASALLLQAKSTAQMGDAPAAALVATQALELSRVLAAPRETAESMALLALLAAAPERAALLNELQELADAQLQDDSPVGAAFSLAQLGRVHLELGEYEEARDALGRALQFNRETARPAAEAETLHLLGLAACRAGDTAAARAALEAASRLAEETGNRYLRLNCRLAMGETLLAMNQHAAAEATLRQVIAAAEDRQRLGNWLHLGRAYGLLIEVLQRQGRGDEARLLVGSD